jgi:hypothetical protein
VKHNNGLVTIDHHPMETGWPAFGPSLTIPAGTAQWRVIDWYFCGRDSAIVDGTIEQGL